MQQSQQSLCQSHRTWHDFHANRSASERYTAGRQLDNVTVVRRVSKTQSAAAHIRRIILLIYDVSKRQRVKLDTVRVIR